MSIQRQQLRMERDRALDSLKERLIQVRTYTLCIAHVGAHRNTENSSLTALLCHVTFLQEHIEELSSLNWAHMCDGGSEGGGAAASLRKQLKAKDLELRQVQRSMGQWKEQTAARLACKFEEELTAELER